MASCRKEGLFEQLPHDSTQKALNEVKPRGTFLVNFIFNVSSRSSTHRVRPAGRRYERTGENWTLILVRELRHPPEKVWQALTDPAHLREWAPFDADGRLSTVGATVKLTTVGAPTPHVTETKVTRADAPKVLVYNWGGNDMRWESRRLWWLHAPDAVDQHPSHRHIATAQRLCCGLQSRQF